MRDPNRKVVMFQWLVIAVLLIGAGAGGYMLYAKNIEMETELESQSGNLGSLRNQLEQAKAAATPAADESSLPAASSNVAGSTTPTPSASVKATATPTPVRAVTP